MAQILDPVPSENSEPILCCYINATSRIQVVRITNIANWYFERVVFPGQRLMFEAPITGQLEVHTGMMASAILSDRIPCQKLAVQQMSGDALEDFHESMSDSKQPETTPDEQSEGHS